MNSKIISIFKYILLLAVAVAILFFAFRGMDVKLIFREMLHAKITWLLLSMGIGLMALVSRAYRWNLLIEPLGYKPPLRKTTYALMIGYLVNLAVPRLGEVTRCGTLSKAEAIPFSSLLGTVIVERAIDLMSLFICLFLTAILEYQRLGDFLTNNIIQPIVQKLSQFIDSPITIIIVSAVVVSIGLFLIYFIRKSKKRERRSKWAKLTKDLYEGLRSVGKLKRPFWFIFHSIFIWVLYFLGTYVCFFALPSTSSLGLSAALFLLVVGGLGMSAPVQGGIGVYHLLVSQGLLLYGLSQQDGLTFATLVHTLSSLMVILFGVVSLFLLFAENKKNASKIEISNPSETFTHDI